MVEHDTYEGRGFHVVVRREVEKLSVRALLLLFQCSGNTIPTEVLEVLEEPFLRDGHSYLIFTKLPLSSRSRKADMLLTLGAQERDFHQGDHQQMLGELKDTPRQGGPEGKPCQAAPHSLTCKSVQLEPELFCRFAETPLLHTLKPSECRNE